MFSPLKTIFKNKTGPFHSLIRTLPNIEGTARNRFFEKKKTGKGGEYAILTKEKSQWLFMKRYSASLIIFLLSKRQTYPGSLRGTLLVGRQIWSHTAGGRQKSNFIVTIKARSYSFVHTCVNPHGYEGIITCCSTICSKKELEIAWVFTDKGQTTLSYCCILASENE